MSTSFKIGDTVEVIDDALKGNILKIEKEKAVIILDDGFEMEVLLNELVKIEDASILQVTNHEVSKIIDQKNDQKKKKILRVKPKERNAPKMEVDLHIHQLTNSSKRMSNYEMLTLQLDTAKHKLDFAIKNRIQKIVFIHGVGEGVLKLELEYLFKKYDQITFYDADYQKYGLGATEVYIYQN
ncbi:DNA mismatch repair protein MutS [Flavobacteriaceae bacterium R38]|nr:DNA mismatch repair protein MutS [Flavobacteriaceae bacterium R38]